MTTGSINLGNNKINLNNDGSGQLAGGNITWDTSGNVTIIGTLKID
jgi:hypothetical protein